MINVTRTAADKAADKKIREARLALANLAARESAYLPKIRCANGDIKQGTSNGLVRNEEKSGLRSVNHFQKKVNHLKCEALRANGDLYHAPVENIFKKRETRLFFLEHYAHAATFADGGKALRAAMLKCEPRGAQWVADAKIQKADSVGDTVLKGDKPKETYAEKVIREIDERRAAAVASPVDAKYKALLATFLDRWGNSPEAVALAESEALRLSCA